MTGGTFGAACFGLNWSEVADAANHAAMHMAAPGPPLLKFFNAIEGADIEAIAAQIIPTDATPGAREAGVVFFIDHGLSSFFAQQVTAFNAGYADFQIRFHDWQRDASRFASLSDERQIDFLHTVEHTAFFESMKLLTVLGMFSMPFYGGNARGVGWKLMGFADEHLFQPPFGFYDRDYPGFAAEKPEQT